MQRVVLKTKGNTTEIWNVFCVLSVGFQLLRTNSDNFMVFLQYRLQGCFLWDGAQFYLFLGGEKRNNHSLAKKENTNHIFSGSKCVFDRWWGKSDKKIMKIIYSCLPSCSFSCSSPLAWALRWIIYWLNYHHNCIIIVMIIIIVSQL